MDINPPPSAYPPLRFRGPLSVVIGTLTACFIPFLIGLYFLDQSMEGFESIELWISHLMKAKQEDIAFDIPLIGIFMFGSILVALLSLRSLVLIKDIEIIDLNLIALRNTGLVHALVAIIQIGMMGWFDFPSIVMLLLFGGLIHLGLFGLVAAPLSLLCAYIFRMIALTRKPAHLISTFD